MKRQPINCHTANTVCVKRRLRIPDWNVALAVRSLWFAVIRSGAIWVYCDSPMSIHRHFPVDRKAVRK